MNGISSGNKPTQEEWEAFRQAIKKGEMAVLGNYKYHYIKPGIPKIVSAEVNHNCIELVLNDLREIKVPLSWFPILQDANEEERKAIISSDGNELIFPLLNTEVTLLQILFYTNPMYETDFLNLCVSDKELLSDITSLFWRLARKEKLSIDEVINKVKTELSHWSKP